MITGLANEVGTNPSPGYIQPGKSNQNALSDSTALYARNGMINIYLYASDF
jgi:hypothetical protein